ncbi:MAG: hypothetical protein HY725_14950 [Candidatus Rokubacteria bacterium]|nr:hypothetical protein [Candidatus Rokubacteria bacterium]
MTRGWRLALWGTVGLLAGAGLPLPAWAVEYRLQVVSLYAESFASFLKPGEFADGASGPGLNRLEASLDRGEVPKGALLYDRHLQGAREGIARAHGGVYVRAEVRQGGWEQELWDEVRWEGKPGEQSVWVVAATTTRTQELSRLALKGVGPLRQFQPYAISANSTKLGAVKVPLNFLWAEEERGRVWQKYVSRVLDLGRGIGAVVGENHNPLFADHVYLIVSQGAEPTTYKAVLVWRRREHTDRGNLESGPSFEQR